MAEAGIAVQDAVLKDLLICFGSKVEVILSHRENENQRWSKTKGTRLDDSILRWMDCPVVACKWEKDKPLQIAVEGTPYAWGVTS